MADLKQRLVTLVGHYVALHGDGELGDFPSGDLAEVGEDYVGIEHWPVGRPLEDDACMYLVLMTRVIHIEHDPNDCPTCPNIC